MKKLYYTKQHPTEKERTDVFASDGDILIGFVRKGEDGRFFAFPLTGKKRTSSLSSLGIAIAYIGAGVYHKNRNRKKKENIVQLKFNMT